MKRKKCQELVKIMCWILIFFVAVLSGPSVGGIVPKNGHDEERSAVGSLGYQWEIGGPEMQERPKLLDVEDRLPARHLLAENDTTVATPPAEDKSIWEEIEEFYSDDNNMAMYCVLPIIVLVYGGCSAIYCVYKCRRYLRRRKHKRLRNEDDGSVTGEERNDLNQRGDNGGEDRQPIKTVSGSEWDDANSAFTDGYNVQRKKTPLPWDTPQKSNQIHRQDSFVDNENVRTRDNANYSSASSDSTAVALERERDKLDRRNEPGPSPQPEDRRLEEHLREKRLEQLRQNQPGTPSSKPPPGPAAKAADFSRFAGSRPIEIVPISQKEYQQHMDGTWDPLHNRPFDSRNSSAAGGGLDADQRRSGRESSWSIRDEIMAKYDALTSLAMAKKTADVLRVNAGNNPNLDSGHHPDTLKRKSGRKSKLIFIAE